MKKKDLYIKYEKDGNRKNRRKRKKYITVIAIVLFFLLASVPVMQYLHVITLPQFNINKKVVDKGLLQDDNNNVKAGNSKDTAADTRSSHEVFDNNQDPIEHNIQKSVTPTEAADVKTSAENKDLQQGGKKFTEETTEGSVKRPVTGEDADGSETGSETNAETEPVKGIYISGYRAGMSDYMKDFISLADNTELNAMVIDVKNDNGEITYKMDQPLAKEIGADAAYINDMPGLIKKLKENKVYLIARVVAFKDPLLAKKRKDLCLKKKDGTIFQDKNGDRWVNPYKKEVWDYLVDIGKEAADLGFDEIQYDYIRFSTDTGMKQVNFGAEAKGKTKTEAISEFTKYACDSLKPLGVKVSADVFGTIIDSKVDAEIVGQDYVKMAEYLDYICPMIYPSHYGEGSFGISYPDTKPYETILAALKKSEEVLQKDQKSSGKKLAIVRPWLQDFTATWVPHHIKYGTAEIRDQIKAVYDAGYTEWLLWNGSNNYTKTALEKN